MPHTDIETARQHMVERQIRTWDVFDPAVLDVMASVPREEFVPQAYRNLAFADMSIPLGHNEVMMQPKVEGRLLQALNINSGDKVLEIGTGSGFLTACLAQFAQHVLSVDVHEDFIVEAQRALTRQEITNIDLETRDASDLNWNDSHYDIIVVTGSMPVLEPSFEARLKPGGRLFVITGRSPIMDAWLITRVSDTGFSRESLFETDIPPLVNAYSPRQFTL
ncbi:MAG: protein-L-isoaspartate O-methyltransferase [Gammaproteobacteria bacterium]|nr:protein-L-isoaspartate O-methyltransferase [Gammaproteobacteria bacterium]